MLNEQFRDPATEEVQEKKMFDLRMGTGAATTYFQELERLTKLARQLHDQDERGLMSIAMTGFNILLTYPDWKARILIMYKEHQKKWVFDQTMGSGTHDSRNPPKGTSNTATSNNKTGGATSLSLGKLMSNAPPRDSQGQWHTVQTKTYGGAGEPMDISKLRSEGRCFQCHEKGHLGKDCPKKREYKDIRSVQVAEQEKTELKIKEVKETAV
ncbi:uncharacterized protein ARMOST_13827 [Armillaria ostoyae]|uniref:CCHC-type domain-containing protein n=1 Tax=Armillaria ostoyae TaxID=47428 RepID=A0A284RNW7_ARMOS|nr:uncharacterized protein ARMOST_13827 [Armillaria ostoyae]